MKKRDIEPADRRLWYCVLDHRMRQVYLGRDADEAHRLCGETGVFGTGKRMGDAITQAAIAAGAALNRRRVGSQ